MSLVASAVGMDVNSSRADLLPQMLEAVLSGGPLPSGGDGGAGAIWRLRAAIPPGARGAIARALPDRAALELTARLELRGMDWSQTSAFCHPADNQGYVRLNLRGRERDGIVDPGEAGALLQVIAEGVASFCDPDGSPAMAGVDRVAEHHDGARADQLPDLVVRWSDGRRRRSPACIHRASATSCAAAPAAGARATTPPEMRGRSSRRAPIGRANAVARRDWRTSRAPSPRSAASTPAG